MARWPTLQIGGRKCQSHTGAARPCRCLLSVRQTKSAICSSPQNRSRNVPKGTPAYLHLKGKPIKHDLRRRLCFLVRMSPHSQLLYCSHPVKCYCIQLTCTKNKCTPWNHRICGIFVFATVANPQQYSYSHKNSKSRKDSKARQWISLYIREPKHKWIGPRHT